MEAQEEEFLAGYSQREQFRTVFGAAFLAGIMLILFAVTPADLPFKLIRLAVIIIAVIGWISSPRTYLLSSNKISIRSIVFRKSISIHDINNAFIVDSPQDIEIHGADGLNSKGFFGYIGTIRSSRYGEIKSFTNRLYPSIYLETEKNRYLISPDNTSDFFKKYLDYRRENRINSPS